MSEGSLEGADAAAVQHEWLRRVEAEYRSAGITHQLTLWLLQLVAPLELIRAGLRIVEDEISHSELSHRVHRAAGGTSPVNLTAATIGLPQPTPDRLLEAVVRVTVENFCLGETVAVRLFSRLRADCTEPTARAALDRILKDEVRHKEFGWTLLEWLLSTPKGDEVMRTAERLLPAAFSRLRQNYAYQSLGQTPPPAPERARWGLMPPTAYATALEETLAKDYLPLFEEAGIDAGKAWHAGLGAADG